MTDIAGIKRWLNSSSGPIRKAGFTKDTRVHPVHCVMEMTHEAQLEDGNLWMFLDIQLMCYSGHTAELSIWGNRCGPDCRSTSDGPQEIDHELYNDKLAITPHVTAEDAKAWIVERLEGAVKLFNDEKAKFGG